MAETGLHIRKITLEKVQNTGNCDTDLYTIPIMDVTALLAQIDSEIARLQQARTALVSLGAPTQQRRGRPPKKAVVKAPKKRTLSPEARARIAAAQKKRWAQQKRSK